MQHKIYDITSSGVQKNLHLDKYYFNTVFFQSCFPNIIDNKIDMRAAVYSSLLLSQFPFVFFVVSLSILHKNDETLFGSPFLEIGPLGIKEWD